MSERGFYSRHEISCEGFILEFNLRVNVRVKGELGKFNLKGFNAKWRSLI